MRVLVIEDDAALQSFLVRGLETNGHTVTKVADGEAAVEQVFLAPFDLVLLDLGLPKCDGMDVLRSIRECDDCLPVLVLTGRDSLQDRLAAFTLGADDFLGKPFSFQELLARGNALHRRGARQNTGVLNTGVLMLDRMGRAVTFGGVSVDLTGKEFALLEYLMLQQGRCSSRRELLIEVWKVSPDSGTNVVDVYINYLRRKLQGTGVVAADPIETVRGEGYRVPMVKRGRTPLSTQAGFESVGESLNIDLTAIDELASPMVAA